MSVTSVISTDATTTKSALMASTANAKAGQMTLQQACDICFEAGDSFASIQGRLAEALKAFKGDKAAREKMLDAMRSGYFRKKLLYTQEQATAAIGRTTYSDDPKLQDDDHRSEAEQNVIDTVKVLWHRANKLAGTLPPKTDGQITAQQNRAIKDAERKDELARLVKSDEIIHPKADTDPFDALTRLALTMRSLANKYSAKLVGDQGTAWRDWLASAPVAGKAKAKRK